MMKSIRTAIVGVGSCASSLVQTVAFSKANDPHDTPGISDRELAGYYVSDIQLVGAFDVDERKVGLDLTEALFAPPNMAVKHFSPSPAGVKVALGPLLDGANGPVANLFRPHPGASQVEISSIVGHLREMEAEVVVCFLPTGSDLAVRAYASAAADLGLAFVNATPQPVARCPDLAEKFLKSGGIVFGDDLRSHLGATTLHSALIDLLTSRGLKIEHTHQLNVGGNADFLNLSSPQRSKAKVDSKRLALGAAGLSTDSVWAGPNGYIPHLGDRKICHIQLSALSILGSRVNLDVKLEVEDSPNAAGVVVNAIRLARIAKERGLKGVIDAPCPFLFKSPRTSVPERQALADYRSFAINPLDRG